MLLIIIFWIMVSMLGLVTYLSSHIIVNTKLTTSLLSEAQQLEAAEAALLQGKRQLTQLVAGTQISNNQVQFELSPVTHADYYVTLKVSRLPHVFCILPMRTQGYYYTLTATIQSATGDRLMSLQSIIALPSSSSCHHKLTMRRAGQSAWCQLPPR
jgi:hypothetical protein